MKRLILAILLAMAIMASAAEANVTTVQGNSFREYTNCSTVQVDSIRLASDSSLFVDRTVQFYVTGGQYALSVYSRVGTHNVVYNDLPATGVFTVNNQDAGDVLVDKTCGI